MEDQRLALQLRAVRTAAGRTVASVAADAGLSVPYIANLENGRGNPTTTALDRLANALGMRLVVTLVPAGTRPDAAAGEVPEVPASLVRFARTGRFRDVTAAIAHARRLDPGDLARRLIPVLAALAAAIGSEPGDTDWGRILDALLLVAAYPRSEPRPPAR